MRLFWGASIRHNGWNLFQVIVCRETVTELLTDWNRVQKYLLGNIVIRCEAYEYLMSPSSTFFENNCQWKNGRSMYIDSFYIIGRDIRVFKCPHVKENTHNCVSSVLLNPFWSFVELWSIAAQKYGHSGRLESWRWIKDDQDERPFFVEGLCLLLCTSFFYAADSSRAAAVVEEIIRKLSHFNIWIRLVLFAWNKWKLVMDTDRKRMQA